VVWWKRMGRSSVHLSPRPMAAHWRRTTAARLGEALDEERDVDERVVADPDGGEFDRKVVQVV
jgi:hypothetical protein